MIIVDKILTDNLAVYKRNKEAEDINIVKRIMLGMILKVFSLKHVRFEKCDQT